MLNHSAKRERGFGNGSVYYNSSRQKWVGQYKIGIRPDGKAEVRTVYAKTEAEAHKKLKTVRRSSRTTAAFSCRYPFQSCIR